MPKTLLQINLRRGGCAQQRACSNRGGTDTLFPSRSKIQWVSRSSLPSPEELVAQAPHLILLQTSSAETVAQTVDSFHRLRHTSPVLWLFCHPEPIDPRLLSKVLQVADDFLFCPFQMNNLTARIQKWLPADDPIHSAERLKIDLGIGAIIGESAAFIEALRLIPRLARSEATVLLAGETGTGKELAARALHYLSPRSAGPFIPVNCAALPETLLENELFGHAKGAYTDAALPQRGLIAEAESGTLFLDEIDGLSLVAQAKLLRFLQEGEYRPLGGRGVFRSDARIVAATNTNLPERVRTGRFREDLYFRLHILSLTLPPLRERGEDIPILAEHFLKKYCRRFGSAQKTLSARARLKLSAYSWPGNVRELEAVIQRAIVLSSSPSIQADEIDLPASTPTDATRDFPFQALKRQTIDTFEKSYLSQLLMNHRGNISRAAKEAGKDRRAFRRLMEKHGLARQQFTQLGEVNDNIR